MKYWTIFAVFFAYIIQISSVVDAASPTKHINTNKGYYTLEKRDRKVHKISDLDSIEDIANKRQWDEDEYNAIMSTMSGGTNNLRHRQLQSTNETYQQKPQYNSTQSVTRGWQKALLISCGCIFFALLFYVISLRNELAHLNQYVPLGYKLFPDNAEEESERPQASGVEMF